MVYTTVGFWAVELLGVPPENCQLYVTAFVEDVLVYCTVSGAQPLVGVAVKFAVGGVTMVTVLVLVTVPQALVAVLLPPSPKAQAYEVALVEVFVNEAVVPLVLLVNPTVGVVFTVT